MTTLRAALTQLFPSIDNASNTQMSDVVGNKNDTLASGSIVGLIKAADAKALAAVTAAETAVTAAEAAVIAAAAAEAAAVVVHEVFDDHFHSASKVYPTLAAGVTVNGGAGAWVLGAATVIVPINTIHSQFDIHYINIGLVSANDTYELVLFTDAACTVEIGRIRFTKTTVQSSTSSTPMMTPILAADTGIWAKVASSSGNDNIVMSVFYHTY